jgi:hypothetical protein
VTVYAFSDPDGIERLRATIKPAPGGGLPSWFQSGAGSPVGVVVPTQTGALYQDTTNGALYVATGPTVADWFVVGGNGDQAATGVTGLAGNFAQITSGIAQAVFITDLGGLNGSGDGISWNPNGGADTQQMFKVQVGSGPVKVHTWDAEGAYVAAGGIGFFATDPPDVKPAAPVTLGDVIAILQGYGMSA